MASDYDDGFCDGIRANVKLKQERIAELERETERLRLECQRLNECLGSAPPDLQEAAREQVLAERSQCEKCGTVFLFANLGVPCPHCIIREKEREAEALRAEVEEQDRRHNEFQIDHEREVERLKAELQTDYESAVMSRPKQIEAARAEGREEEREKSRKAVDAACAAMADDLKARGYRKGLEEAAKLAETVKHPVRGDGVGEPGREKFYQTHIRHAWVQAGHRIAAAIRAKLDGDTPKRTLPTVRCREDGTVIPRRPCCRGYIDEPHLHHCKYWKPDRAKLDEAKEPDPRCWFWDASGEKRCILPAHHKWEHRYEAKLDEGESDGE